MNVSGTQTGRLDVVKKNYRPSPVLTRALFTLAVLSGLTACAPSVGGWRQPTKNEAMTRADYAQCQDQAEAATLTLRRSERPGYGTQTANPPGTFNPRGDNTMVITEKSDSTTLYNALLANCMARKGYRQPGDS